MSAAIFSVGLVIFLAYFFVGVFERTRIPDVFLLMLLGIFIGPVLGLVCPADFGKIGTIATTVALIVILFEGGINLNISQVKESLDETAYVALSSFVVSVVLIGFMGWGIFGLPTPVAIMLGTILGGTSSAVVIPIIKKLKLSNLAYMVLFLESALTDVLCIVVTMGILVGYSTGQISTGAIFGQILASLVLASVIGVLGGMLWALMIKKIKGFPVSPVSMLAFVFVLFGVAEFLNYSGAIASLAFGITLANMKDVPLKKIRMQTYFSLFAEEQITEYERSFFEELVFLLKIFFFVYLGISIGFGRWKVILGGLLITVVLFLGRALVIRFAMPKRVTREDAMAMAVLIPKGLAAAVLASIPMQMGVPGGEILRDTAYVVVLFSIGLAALLVSMVERKSRLVYPLFEKLFAAFPKTVSEESK